MPGLKGKTDTKVVCELQNGAKLSKRLFVSQFINKYFLSWTLRIQKRSVQPEKGRRHLHVRSE